MSSKEEKKKQLMSSKEEKKNNKNYNQFQKIDNKKEEIYPQTYGNEFQAYNMSDSDDESSIELTNQNPSFTYKFIY